MRRVFWSFSYASAGYLVLWLDVEPVWRGAWIAPAFRGRPKPGVDADKLAFAKATELLKDEAFTLTKLPIKFANAAKSGMWPKSKERAAEERRAAAESAAKAGFRPMTAEERAERDRQWEANANEDRERRGYDAWAERLRAKFEYEDRVRQRQAARASGFDCWQVLGLPPDANVPAVKAAFRLLVRRAHPDHGGTTEAFVRLKKAYDDALMLAKHTAVDSPTPSAVSSHA